MESTIAFFAITFLGALAVFLFGRRSGKQATEDVVEQARAEIRKAKEETQKAEYDKETAETESSLVKAVVDIVQETEKPEAPEKAEIEDLSDLIGAIDDLMGKYR